MGLFELNHPAGDRAGGGLWLQLLVPMVAKDFKPPFRTRHPGSSIAFHGELCFRSLFQAKIFNRRPSFFIDLHFIDII
jgi:hypothetical protein